MKSRYLFFIVFVLQFSALVAKENVFVNYDEKISDFILDEKQIVIPGYPSAFNPSIIRWENGRLVLCFRDRDPKTNVANVIGFAWLDDNFEVVGKPVLLEIKKDYPLLLSKAQGPRLIKIGNIHWIAYNNSLDDNHPEARRMILAHLHYDQGRFYIDEPKPVVSFQGDLSRWREKNWSPFDYRGYIHFSYTINPHRVFRFSKTEQRFQMIALTNSNIDWDLGEIRGGAPALIDGDHYLGFFHSWKDLKSVQSEGAKISHFFMGAYCFKNKPPFQVTHISKEPIIGKTFFHAPNYPTWKPLKVIYPGGFVFNDDFVWVVYGRQDHECWVVKMDKARLMSSLQAVN